MNNTETTKKPDNIPSTDPQIDLSKPVYESGDKSQQPPQQKSEQPYQHPYQQYPYHQPWLYHQSWQYHQHPGFQQPYGFEPHRGHQRGHHGHHGRGWGRGYPPHQDRREHHHQRRWHHEERSNGNRQEQPQYDASQQYAASVYAFPHQQQMMHPYPNEAPQHLPPPPPHFMPPPPFWRDCWEGEGRGRRGKRGGWKGRKHSSSHSHSRSSSSSSSSSQSRHKKGSTKKAESIKYEEEISGHYRKEMQGFLESRSVNEKQGQKIIGLLKRNYPAFDAPIPNLLQCVELAEKEQLLFRMSYVKVIKVLIRCRLDLSEAIPKLQRIQEHKLRKFQADSQFVQNYGNQTQTPLLEVNQLIIMQADSRPLLFLVDGNNILPTNKHLRRYFQSRQPLDRVVGQLRTRWYISHCLPPNQVVLFFDERFQDAEYQLAQQCTFPNEQEQQRASQIQVVYGEESKADDKIIKRLQDMSEGKEKAEIVLVSADRELKMRCQQILPILHTSGKYFFKFCKYNLSRKYKGDKILKRMARGINTYEEEKDRVIK